MNQFKEDERLRRQAYRRSIHGVIINAWHRMRARVEGRTYSPLEYNKKYIGLPILTKEEFFKWVKSSNIKAVHARWKKHSYIRNLSPTIDRIDSSKGYTLDNIQWLSFNENARKANSKNWQLTDEVVLKILLEYKPKTYGKGKRVLARKYKVSPDTIQNIVNKKSWKHLHYGK